MQQTAQASIPTFHNISKSFQKFLNIQRYLNHFILLLYMNDIRKLFNEEFKHLSRIYVIICYRIRNNLLNIWMRDNQLVEGRASIFYAEKKDDLRRRRVRSLWLRLDKSETDGYKCVFAFRTIRRAKGRRPMMSFAHDSLAVYFSGVVLARICMFRRHPDVAPSRRVKALDDVARYFKRMCVP